MKCNISLFLYSNNLCQGMWQKTNCDCSYTNNEQRCLYMLVFSWIKKYDSKLVTNNYFKVNSAHWHNFQDNSLEICKNKNS